VADGGHDAVDEPAADESSTAKWISIIAGAAMIVMSAVTNYEDGFLSHAIWTAAQRLAAVLAIGLGELATAAMTDPVPGERTARARETRRTM